MIKTRITATIADVWSTGCVLAELMLGQAVFPGTSGVDQIVEIIRILGTPSRDQLRSMNENYHEFKFPQIKPQAWAKVCDRRVAPRLYCNLRQVFKSRTAADAIDLVTVILQYNPEQRLTPARACEHAFFQPLKSADQRLPNGSSLPAFPSTLSAAGTSAAAAAAAQTSV